MEYENVDEEVVYNVLSKTKMSSSEILNSVNFGRSKHKVTFLF